MDDVRNLIIWLQFQHANIKTFRTVFELSAAKKQSLQLHEKMNHMNDAYKQRLYIHFTEQIPVFLETRDHNGFIMDILLMQYLLR